MAEEKALDDLVHGQLSNVCGRVNATPIKTVYDLIPSLCSSGYIFWSSGSPFTIKITCPNSLTIKIITLIFVLALDCYDATNQLSQTISSGGKDPCSSSLSRDTYIHISSATYAICVCG